MILLSNIKGFVKLQFYTVKRLNRIIIKRLQVLVEMMVEMMVEQLVEQVENKKIETFWCCYYCWYIASNGSHTWLSHVSNHGTGELVSRAIRIFLL